MSKPGWKKGDPDRRRRQLAFEGLERRGLLSNLPLVGFQAAFGLGSTGKYSAIHSNAVATDAAGDTFITGSFRGSAGFDPASSGSTIATNGTQDTFVAKYSAAGALDWVQTFVGHPTTANGQTTYAVGQGSAIAVDGSGNVFLAGSFEGTVDFGAGSNLTELSSPGGTDPFAAKLDAAGNLLWVATAAGTAGDTDSANALALDGSGGVVIAGSYSDSITFGPGTVTAGGASDAFVARINAAGRFTWSDSTQGQSGSNAGASGIAVDGSGNVALAGYFSGSVGFSSGNVSNDMIAYGSDDAAVWKLDPNGNFLWARDFGSPDYDQASAVAVDPSGNLYATGSFSDTVAFGAGPSGDSLTAGPIFDAFTVKLTPSGIETWAKGDVGPGGWAKGQSIAYDPATGGVDLAGTFSGTVDFDPGPSTDNLTSGGSTDAFVTGLDASGNLVYALHAGQTNANSGLGVAANPTGTVAVTGSYSGSIALGGTTLPSAGVTSIFVGQVVNQTPPPVPASPVLEASSDTGVNDTTSINSPVFDLVAAATSDTVELLRDGAVVGRRVGSGSIQDAGPVPDGSHAYTAIQLSTAGYASAASPSTTVTIITVPPPKPAAPSLESSDDSGGPGLTNVRSPRLIGSAQANATVQLFTSTGTVLGTTTANSTGAYTVQVTSSLADGSYAIDAVATDAANNVSPVGTTFNLTIDATAPPAPPAPALLLADDSGAPGVTNVRSPRFTGTVEANAKVQLFSSTGTLLGSTTAGSTGSYTVKLNATLADGTYVIDAVATDGAGNVGQAGSAYSLTIDTTPPAAAPAPSLVLTDDSGAPGITNVRSPRLMGTAEANATVQLFNSTGTLLATTTASSTGTYTVKLNATLADGTYVIDAVATDGAGNVGQAGSAYSLTIDTTAPAAPPAPTLLLADDSGAPGVTNVRSPRLTGTAEANATVQLFNSTGGLLGTGTASSSGAYTIKLTSSLADGTYSIDAVATDAANNFSTAGASYSLMILGTPPATPSVPVLLPADDSGVVGDGTTNVKAPRLVVSAATGLTVEIVNASNVVVGSSRVSVGGSYTITPSSNLPDGAYAFRAVVLDSAGNPSAASSPVTLVILATPPPKPAAPALLSADDTGVSGDGMTSVTRPRLVGTAVAGGRIDWVASNGSILASTTAPAMGGTYQLQAPTDFPNGVYVVQVRETDVAGNVSPISPTFTLTIRATTDDALGDGRTDVTVFRPTDQTFYLQQPSTQALYAKPFGIPGDVPVSGDFFGDGHGDIAIFRPSTATFYVSEVGSNNYLVDQWGAKGDVPVPGDYDGSGKTDSAVFRPTDGTFYIRMNGVYFSKAFGQAGDIPVPADYFGDGRTDLAVYRPSTSTFYAYDPANGAYKSVTLGQPGDTPVPADYEGIGHADFAVFRPSNSTFYAQMSTNANYQKTFGIAGDVPVAGDYFGGGRASMAVYRPSTATFYAFDVASNAVLVKQWGAPLVDKPATGPITSWFSLGGKGSPAATSANSGTAATIIPLDAPEVPDPSAAAPGSKVVVDRAIEGLGLERWRVAP